MRRKEKERTTDQKEGRRKSSQEKNIKTEGGFNLEYSL